MPGVHDMFLITLIPNQKADFNNFGPFSTDYIGHSWKYPEASYAEKAALWQEHLLYTKALLYFVSHDDAVPANLRAELNQWGLPKDEYADTDHWSNQLYIREGRRMIGAYVTAVRPPDRKNKVRLHRNGIVQQRLAQHSARCHARWKRSKRRRRRGPGPAL